MAGITERLHRYLGDPVVLRVCIFIYGGLFVCLGLALFLYPPMSPDWVFIVVSVGCAALGSSILYTAVRGRRQLLQKMMKGFSYSELLGVLLFLAVFVVAIPISSAIRSTRLRRENSQGNETA
jgi:heme O synthase-like polyprenyltransferase